MHTLKVTLSTRRVRTSANRVRTTGTKLFELCYSALIPMTQEKGNHITKEDQYLTNCLVTSEDRVVVLAFTAAWVGSFFLFRGYLEDLKEEYKSSLGLKIVDIEKYSGIARRLGVSQVPTTILLRNHEVVDMLVGTTSRNKLMDSVAPYLNP